MMRFTLSTCVLAALLAPTLARGQGPRVADGASSGYELTLHGSVRGELGGQIRLTGVAWQVSGLDTLRAGRGLEVEGRLTEWRSSSRHTVRTVTVRAGAEGRFELVVPLDRRPLSSPQLVLTVRRPGQPGREFSYSVGTTLPEQIDLLVDRRRYEPGETVHVWSRVTSVVSRAPVAQRSVRLSLFDASGRPSGERTVPTSAAGVATVDFELPDSAANGSWRLQAELTDTSTASAASQSFDVTRRTVERLQAELTLGQPIVGPGRPITGRVTVLTPSGSPVRGARVEIHLRGASEPIVLESDRQGQARFESRSPAFLSGEVATETVQARVVHPAHGTITAAASYLLARVRWLVEATAESGAIVPEVDSALFLSVADPRGRPIEAGTTLAVRGLGVRGGRVEVTTDGRGLAEVPMRLPRGAAARMRSGRCSGQVATSVEVEVQATQPVVARLCARVALDAQVLLRAEEPVVRPGAEVRVSLQRRPSVARRPVLLEALWSGRAVASAWVEPSRSAARLQLPAGIQGQLLLRARPVLSSDRRRPFDEPGATALGVGSVASVLVRPADAFGLEVTPERELYRIRDRAGVTLRASKTPGQGWATLLVRDEAAHGGEVPWDLQWLRGELAEAAASPADEANERWLRTSLAGATSPDVDQVEPPPLVNPPWRGRHHGSYSTSRAAGTGVLRDPLALREELRRRWLGRIMTSMEQVVTRFGQDEDDRRGVVRRSGRRVSFDPAVVRNLVKRGHLSRDGALTLGGEPLTLGMITKADPSFSFDRVARRVARGRLATLLLALSRLADPDNPHAARAIAGQPPERWLSRLVQLGMVNADALVDPWGRPFVFRRAPAGRTPAVVVSERALSYELVSPGPDGAAGTGDDVRDPFERAVPRGSLYAIASGEDQLMERLGRLAPGSTVLAAMARSYGRVGLAALEERRRGPVDASGSEDAAELDFDEGLAAGALMGAGDSARRMRAPARQMAPSPSMAAPGAPAAEPMEAEEREALAEDQAESPPPPPSDSRVAAMGQIVREDFPATLHFVAEVPFGPDGTVRTEVPLADALTTYRLEAIAWTASGWVTSGMGRLRVDQEAMVDAPVPAVGTVGDLIRLPVRVANRTREVLPVEIEIETDGDLSAEVSDPPRLDVPALDAVEAVVDVRLGAPGSGRILVRALRADSGRTLDAVRRPMEVFADVRLARETREELVFSGDVIRVEVPEEASDRGPGELRLAVGSALFGDPAVWGERSRDPWAAWALTAAGRDLPPGLHESVGSMLPDDEEDHTGDPTRSALILASAWRDERLSDEGARALLRGASRNLPAEDSGVEPSAIGEEPSWVLLALAPAIEHLGSRPELRDDAHQLVTRLRQLVSSQAAQATDAPIVWARAAVGLAMSGGADDPRAREMLRRASRHLVAVGDEAWLEPLTTDGTAGPRLEPTSLMALTRIALGERRAALPFLRSLVAVVRGADRWPTRTRALASAAAALIAGGTTDGSVRLDGQTLDMRVEDGVVIAELPGIGRPGTHTLEVVMPEGSVALAWVDLRYGLPWSVRPRREAQVDVRWSGPAGARDGRSGLLLTLRNRGARVLTRPVVEVELPAGVELDEPTRESMGERLVEAPTLEGRTLTMRLRPLAPGGYLRIPMPLRWAVGGTLIGLGTTVWDDTGSEPLAVRPVQVLPSRGVEVADRGRQPDQPEGEASPPPEVDPIPLPRPVRPIFPIGPVAEVRP